MQGAKKEKNINCDKMSKVFRNKNRKYMRQKFIQNESKIDLFDMIRHTNSKDFQRHWS